MTTATEPSRLFVRQLPTPLADLPFGAVPSDTSLPNTLRQDQFYAAALTKMEGVMPLPVAALRDQLDRVKAAQERFTSVRMEELTWLQFANEDARDADKAIEGELTTLRQKRDALEQEHETRIEERIGLRTQARQAAVAAFAVAGLSLEPLRGELRSEDDEFLLPSATPAGIETPTETLPQPTRPAARLGGFLRTVLQKPSPAVLVPESNLPSNRAPLPHRLVPEFAADEVSVHVVPAGSVALHHGLSLVSPTLHTLENRQRWIEWPALAICGTIFGVSLGILIEILDARRLVTRPEAMIVPTLLVGGIGIAIFWVLGRVARGLMAFASESWHAVVADKSRLDVTDAKNALRKMSVGVMLTTVALFVLLVVIESSVERYGILGALLSHESNARLLKGQSATAAPVSVSIQIALALVVSLPFLLLHGLHGWVEGKVGAFTHFVENQVSHSLWEAQKTLHEQRTTELAEINSDLLGYRRGELAEQARQNLPQELSIVEPSVPDAYPTDPGKADVDIEIVAPFRHSLLPDGSRLHLSTEQGWPLGTVAAAMLAVAQAREAHSQVRRAQAKKREALAVLDRDIQRWESRRYEETRELSAEAKQRIGAAHAAYAEASRRFDKLYQQEWKRYEHLTRAGLLRRIWHYLFGQGATMTR